MKIINHECYVSLEVAKLLKQAGFDWPCNHSICCDSTHYPNLKEGDVLEYNHLECSELMEGKKPHMLLCPTLAVAQRWLREIRHRSIEVKSFVDGTVENRGKWWIWHVYDFNPPIDWVLLMSSDCRYSTYEEAQEAGIKKALEIILEKKRKNENYGGEL